MKTLNSKNNINRHIKIFNKDDKYCGFSGIVKVVNKNIYVNTATGSGYEKVIKELRGMINFLAAKYKFSGAPFDDRKQNVIIHILEGIPKYDPRKNTKLSSFLQMRINRQLINELRNESRISRNATFLKIGTFYVTCKCGASESINIPAKDDLNDYKCTSCESSFKDARQIVTTSTPELNSSDLCSSRDDSENTDKLEYMSQNIYGDSIFGKEDDLSNMAEYMHDLYNWLKDEDPRVAKIVELVCYKDYTITDAARCVGLTGAGASLKLKSLRKKKVVREILGR